MLDVFGCWTGKLTFKLRIGPTSFVPCPHPIPCASLAEAAFTRLALWRLDSIDKTYAGTWCFRPGPNPAFSSACVNATLSTLLNIYLRNELGAGLSIAYYDLADGSVLGGVGWTGWDFVDLLVGVCMSGAVNGLDNAFRTVCRFAIADNDHDSPDAHAQECVVPRTQLHVADGCYSPPARHGPFHLDDTANAIIAILALLIVVPGMILGVYRWYMTRKQAQNVDGQDVPLVQTGATGLLGHQDGTPVAV